VEKIRTGEGGRAKNSPKHHRSYREWARTPTLGKEPVPELIVDIMTRTTGGKTHRKIFARKLLSGNHCMPFNLFSQILTIFFNGKMNLFFFFNIVI